MSNEEGMDQGVHYENISIGDIITQTDLYLHHNRYRLTDEEIERHTILNTDYKTKQQK